LNTLWKAMLAASVVVAAITVAVVLTFSRDSRSGVSLTWAGPDRDSGEVIAPARIGEPLETVVYIFNDTGESLRDASLRFSPNRADAPPGFSLGTVARVSSHFEGSTQVWPLGDIPPGTRVVFHLGLWFDATGVATAADGLGLTLQLSSPDLESPLTSNELQVTIAR
jgi:hypothetical protein